MSLRAMLAVLDHSKSEKGARLVLLSIAENADDHGRNQEVGPGIATIARKANLSRRATQYAIAHLEKIGELKVKREAGRSRTNLYSILLPGLKGANSAPSKGASDDTKGAVSDTKKVQPTAPEPNTEPSSLSADADDSVPTQEVLQRVLLPNTKYPGTLVARLGKQVKQHLKEGFSTAAVIVAARRAMAKGRPELLATFLAEQTPVADDSIDDDQVVKRLKKWAVEPCPWDAEGCDHDTFTCSNCDHERRRILSGAA